MGTSQPGVRLHFNPLSVTISGIVSDAQWFGDRDQLYGQVIARITLAPAFWECVYFHNWIK